MADMKIEDATRVTSVDGSEILPASVGGAAKSLTAEQMKNYVVGAIAALTDASDWGASSSDRILVRQNGELKSETVANVTSVVFDTLMGKSAATTLADSDTLIVKNGETEATVTLEAIAEYVGDALEEAGLDIHGLTAIDSVADADELPVYDASATGNKKATLSQIASAVVPKTATLAEASQAAMASTDEFIIASGGALKRVALQSAGITADGKVTAPNTNTDGKIPQWDGTNSKTLKDGLSVATSVGSTSTDSEVPTAKAVNTQIAAEVAGKVVAPSENTDGKIPQWDGSNSKTLSDGLAVATSVGSTSTNTQVATAKAVYDHVAEVGGGKVVAPSANTDGKIPQWNGSNSKTLSDGLTVATTVAATSTDAEVPTAKAVNDAIGVAAGDKVFAPAGNTLNNIPQWSGNDNKTLKDGLSVVTAVSATSTDTEVPTAKAVNDRVATIGSDKVAGPATNTDGKVPQWNGTNSRTLSDGLAVSTTVSASSTDSELPTAKAVQAQIAAVAGGKVIAPDTNTANNIPQWNGANSKTLKDGLGVATEISTDGIAVDTKLATEKAVRDLVDNECVITFDTPVAGGIPYFSSAGDNGMICSELTKATSIRASGTASDMKLATEKAVRDALANCIEVPTDLTDATVDYIPTNVKSNVGVITTRNYYKIGVVTGGYDAANVIPTGYVMARAMERFLFISDLPAAGTIPYFANNTTRSCSTKTIATSITNAAAAGTQSDNNVPTEKAVVDLIAAMHRKGTEAAADAIAQIEGATYFNTSTNKLYMYLNGSAREISLVSS